MEDLLIDYPSAGVERKASIAAARLLSQIEATVQLFLKTSEFFQQSPLPAS